MGAQPLSEQLHCHWGNEVKQIQTTGNAAKVSGPESSRAGGCCNRSLSAEIGSWFPCICCQHCWLVLARKKKKKVKTQHRPRCYSALGYTSLVPPKWPRDQSLQVPLWPGIFQSPLSLFHGPFLTLSSVPLCSKLLLWELVLNTKKLLLSVEHISPAQRASVMLSKVKQTCAKTLMVRIDVQLEKRRWNHCSMSTAHILCTHLSLQTSPDVTVVSHQSNFIYKHAAWCFTNTQDLNLIITILNELMVPLTCMLLFEILERDWVLKEKQSCE